MLFRVPEFVEFDIGGNFYTRRVIDFITKTVDCSFLSKAGILNIRQDRKANTSKLLPDDAKDRIGKMDI